LKYVHGYDQRENIRLQDQASTLSELLHHDTIYPAYDRILETGCGVGAQTITLARNSPESQLISIDISARSIAEAKNKIEVEGLKNVTFQQGDIFELPFKPESFDHIFVCFVLEHLVHPDEALNCLKGLLKVGGTMTVIEGDHGSTYFYPDNEAAHKAIRCQVQLQKNCRGKCQYRTRAIPSFKQNGFYRYQRFPTHGLR
jgi:ubiquinone/menaquinone biosynthesis C-methylase UbiE